MDSTDMDVTDMDVTDMDVTHMDATDLEVVNVLVFQQLLESVESESWAEAAMALYKLYDIEAGQRFLDQDEIDEQLPMAA